MTTRRISFHPTLAGPVGVAWPESAAIAAAAGFDAIDLSLREIASHSAEDIGGTLASHGLVAGGVPLPVEFRRDEATFATDFADLPALAQLAADVGVQVMYRSLPASHARPAAELGPLLRRRLIACVTVLDEHGIRLALESIGPLHRRREGAHEFLWRLPDLAAFAESCGASVGVLADSWHWHHLRAPAQDIVDLGPRILHAHIADAPPLEPDEIRDDQRLLPGDGVIDLDGFLAALDSAGYTGIISPEIPGTWGTAASPLESARRARAAVDRFSTSGDVKRFHQS